jgi:2-oxoglutarate ferredoxin oxidoreductase subunit alpha
LPIVSTSSPSDAFDAAFEAARIAIKYMTPVILLTDGYVATSSEPWRLPDLDALPDISRPFATHVEGEDFLPYLRDEGTLSRPWAIPGQPGLEHRLGGLEKNALTGNVEYGPDNHELMTQVRARKVAGIAQDIPDVEVYGEGHDLLVLGWGSTYGAIRTAVNRALKSGRSVAHAHLRHLNPFPQNLGAVLEGFDRILVPEINMGQLSRLIRAEYLVPTIGYNRVQGLPIKARDIETKIYEILDGEATE